jgi:hypothetical protein
MKMRLDVASKARWFKSRGNGGAGQNKKNQMGYPVARENLERPPVVGGRLKVSPDEMLRLNISSGMEMMDESDAEYSDHGEK